MVPPYRPNRTKAAALALAPHNIRVNAVGPGSIDTAMMASINTNPEAMEMVMSRTPLKRMGTPREIGDVVAFLVSLKARYITCLLYTSQSPRDGLQSRMPSSA